MGSEMKEFIDWFASIGEAMALCWKTTMYELFAIGKDED
jgi:hypothetical protein